jgi:hypothetical protein
VLVLLVLLVLLLLLLVLLVLVLLLVVLLLVLLVVVDWTSAAWGAVHHCLSRTRSPVPWYMPLPHRRPPRARVCRRSGARHCRRCLAPRGAASRRSVCCLPSATRTKSSNNKVTRVTALRSWMGTAKMSWICKVSPWVDEQQEHRYQP